MTFSHSSSGETEFMQRLKDATLWLVDETVPETDREFHIAKAYELFDGVSPDVLYARYEDGSRAMDREFTGGFLLLWKGAIDRARDIQHQQVILDKMKKLLIPKTSVGAILEGDYGEVKQRAFLNGALYGVALMIEAELIERDLLNRSVVNTM